MRGPYKVITRIKRTEGDIYTVQDLVTNKLYDFHVKLLQPYHYDATRTNPIDTVLRDYPTQETEMTIIEKIIKHKFHPKENHARNLQLLVKLQGSEEPEWTKYTEKTIKKVAKVHDYLYENKLGSFVPQKFTRIQEMWLPYFMTIVHEKLHEIFKNCQDNRLQRLIICYINFLFCFGSIYGT